MIALNETISNTLEKNDDYLPLRETEAVLASEQEDGPHRFRIVGCKIKKGVASSRFGGTYTQSQPLAKPLDADINCEGDE